MSRILKKTSDEIIELIQEGVSKRQIASKGYPESTVRYYYMKIKQPKRFASYIKKVQGYQKALKERNKATK